MSLAPNLQRQIAGNTLDFGSDIIEAIKNPFRALYLPMSWLWKLGRPLVGMSNKQATEIPAEIIKLGQRTNIGAICYATRLAWNEVLNLTVMPISTGNGMQSIREATATLKQDVLNFNIPEKYTSESTGTA